jgi:hypothetical protein
VQPVREPGPKNWLPWLSHPRYKGDMSVSGVWDSRIDGLARPAPCVDRLAFMLPRVGLTLLPGLHVAPLPCGPAHPRGEYDDVCH